MLGCPGSLPLSPLPQQEDTACVCPGLLQLTLSGHFSNAVGGLTARPASGVTTATVTGLMAESFSLEKQQQTDMPLSLLRDA